MVAVVRRSLKIKKKKVEQGKTEFYFLEEFEVEKYYKKVIQIWYCDGTFKV